MSAASVATASRTRMRPSDTRTLFMCAVIHGRAPRCRATIGRSTSRQRIPARPMRVVTVGMSSLDRDLERGPAYSTVVSRQDTLLTRTGRSGSDTFKRCTSSESATHPRSSTGPTTSGSISSTVTQARAASGLTCWRTPVLWRRTPRRGENLALAAFEAQLS